MTQQTKNILIGITGGIAAYKIPLLVRQLIQNNYNVKIIMTDDAQHFVTPETLSVLSKNPVYTSFFNEKREWNNHVHLADWADLLIIAPATANTLAKMANGYCDNLLMATYLSYTKKVLIAPAMDAEMWENEEVQNNIQKIKEKKHHIVLPVEYGELASGIKGWGRMIEPQEIFKYIQKVLVESNDLKGKKVIVTAGATYEPIDPVRFIGNRSSGKMGIAIAEELALRGAEVFLIYGNIQAKIPALQNIHSISAPTAESMYNECTRLFPESDVAILAAAVADYTPVNIADKKIKKNEDTFIIELKKTKDILKSLGEIKKSHQLLIGFALETDNLIENATKKIKTKNADIIFANECSEKNPAFNADENELIAIYKDGTIKNLDKHKKNILAEKIIDLIKIFFVN
ncbi:MAG: bifunctional phosphopantothenoylcysteine decarboxylase/phosphopantothenate--cysteine ligase CoaBC [Bacteroidia bacterium]